MQYKGGSIIKNLRKDMGISQEELAKRLSMSQRQLSRVENGEAELDWLEFTLAFQALLGLFNTDFWIMYLDYDEFLGYRQYQSIREHIKNGLSQEARAALTSLEQSPLVKQPFMAQFVLAMGFILDEMDDESRKRGLYEALSMSIADFDISKIDSYAFNYNEVLIINELALVHSRTGSLGLAIDMLYSICNGAKAKRLRVSKTDEKLLYPMPMVNLYRLLILEGRYGEAASICETALESGLNVTNLRFHPESTYALALCLKHMGKPQDDYLPLLRRAYHGACGLGQNELAKEVKEAYNEAIGK